MTIAKPITMPLLLGLLILAAVAFYATVSLSLSFAPSRPSIALPLTTQTESRAHTGNGKGPSSPSSPSSADAGQKPPGSGAPAESVGGPGRGIQRFADAGPDIVAPAAPQTAQMCGPKPCPRPQR